MSEIQVDDMVTWFEPATSRGKQPPSGRVVKINGDHVVVEFLERRTLSKQYSAIRKIGEDVGRSLAQKTQRRNMAVAHAEGQHDDMAREFCPECEAKR